MKEFSIDTTQMGVVYSAYLFIYTICMMPGGWFIDRFGPKKCFMLLGFGSALLVPLTGVSTLASTGMIILALCAIRGVLGAVNAPMHPCAARAVSFWIPYRSRGFANGLITGAALVGIASTYFVFGGLMDKLDRENGGPGWQLAFAVAGVATLLLAIVWTWYATDRPGQHAGVNHAERELIEEGDPLVAVQRSAANNLAVNVDQLQTEQLPDANPAGSLHETLTMCKNRSLILLTISFGLYGYLQYLFFYWIQYYFDDVLKFGKDESRLYSTIALISMAVGMILGGWLLDCAQARFSRWLGRAIVPMAGLLISTLFLFLGVFSPDVLAAILASTGVAIPDRLWIVGCFSVVMAAAGACESPFWVTATELGGRRGGMAAAILNTGGNAGGILAPILTPYISKHYGWSAGVSLAGLFCLIGAFLWIWIDPDERDPLSRLELDVAQPS